MLWQQWAIFLVGIKADNKNYEKWLIANSLETEFVNLW